ncbi:unnamed protein product [Strongylus vulgaris]|uniref:Uncharacterized protein n=1 Tax=Strongylus vulgaris TaxID=40348 RepID=A0A3P7JM21_STRVU|nr:unnamed protein product [Strongylus vulgaris]
MEYLENAKSLELQNVTINAVKEVLRALAAMEAMSLKFNSEEKNMLTKTPFRNLHKLFYGDDFITSMKDLRTFCGGKLSDKVAKIEEVVQDMDPDWIDQLADELGTI